MSAQPLPRSQRMLRYLAAHPEGVRVREIRDAVDAEASIATISAQLCQAVDAGKARRTGAAHHSVYFPTKLTLVDKRSRHTASATPTRQAAQKRRVDKALQPASKRQLREAAPPPPPPADSPLRQSITRMPTGARKAVLDSDQIAADVAEFLRRGGRIQQLKPGESSRSLAEAHDAYLASRSRGRAAQLAVRKSRKAADDFDDDTESDDSELAAA